MPFDSKVVLNVAVSLDGFLDDKEGKFDWCFSDQDYGMTDFLARTGALLLGRNSYELLLSMDSEYTFPQHAKYIFSETLQSVQMPNTYIVGNGKLHETVKFIRKQTQGKDLWLFGGAVLIHHFLEARLVNEMILSIHPLLLGGGKPLFADLTQRQQWQLNHVKAYSTGLVQSYYSFLD